MPIDPSLSLQVQQPQSNLDAYTKALTLKHLMSQDAMLPLQQQAAQQSLKTRQLQNQQLEMGIAKQKAISDSFVVKPDGSLDKEASIAKLYRADPQTAAATSQQWMKNDNEFRDMMTKRAESADKDISASAAAVQAVIDKNIQGGMPPDVAFHKAQPLIAGYIDQVHQTHGKEFVTIDPSKITPEWLKSYAMKNPTYMKANLPKAADNDAFVKEMIAKGVDPKSPQGQVMLQKHLDKMDAPAHTTVNVGGAGSGFEGRNGEILASLAEKGVSLPAGFRSKQQQLGLLNALSKRNPDLSPDQIADKIKTGQIDLANLKVEGRTAAGIAGKVAYAENEIEQTIPLVREASAKLPRGEFLPYSKLKQMGEKEFSNPDLAEFKMYMTSLSNAYDMLAARGGTDAEKRAENRKNFDTAQSPEALERVMKAVQNEAQASGRAAAKSMDVTHKGGDQPKVMKFDAQGNLVQ